MRAYRIAYDGSDYHGFQRQPDVPTVSDAILDALRTLDVVDDRSVPADYAAAGRTDAGVSATHQTVAFEAPDWLEPPALNSELPADVRAWASTDVPDGFHATYDATAREYTYYLYAPEADLQASETDHQASDADLQASDADLQASDADLQASETDHQVSETDHQVSEGDTLRPGADRTRTKSALGDSVEERARTALDALAGEHDFHNLTPDETGTVRNLETTLAIEGAFLVISVGADGFPRQLVRRLVTVVDEVARGDATLTRIDEVLGSDPIDGPAGVQPAPPSPLVLTAVAYPGIEFTVDSAAAATARRVFEERRRAHAVRARVAERLRDR